MIVWLRRRFLDFNDTYAAARAMLGEAARPDPKTGNSWLSEATTEVTIRILLYNGEIGVYSQISLIAGFTRGGQIELSTAVETARVPHWPMKKLIVDFVYLVLVILHCLMFLSDTLLFIGAR
jgi:hypothetical protein